jgi:choline dehydrogenase-like flavoprotein
MSGFTDGGTLHDGQVVKADACVIGSGAGGAVTAAKLQAAGIETLVLEEGGYHTKREFRMREDINIPMLYQEAGARMTKDVGMLVLQGRTVGGSTVINWTTCFRTPEKTLDLWKSAHGVTGFEESALRPHWDAIEKRLSIRKWTYDEANRNNRLLYDGFKALGYGADTLSRNVKNCFKSGYCGMGCPVDAKQSMLVTYLPDAVAKGATVLSRCRVDRLELSGSRVVRAHCTIMGDDGYNPSGAHITVEAKRFVLSAGGIGTPAILMRSGLGGGVVGKRTYLHPAAGVISLYKDPVEAFYGAPQTTASHHFADRGDKVGFFAEAAPLHPVFLSTFMPGIGESHRAIMDKFAFMSGHGAISIDGHHPDEPGGEVVLRKSGAPQLDYVIPPRVWEALREGLRTLVRANLAMGAKACYTAHDPMVRITSEADLGKLDAAAWEPTRIGTLTAHVMGGARMGGNPAESVVRCEDLRHHTVENLHVIDGSILPTSLGVNPQLTIYGIARMMSERLASGWKA